jgi:hypothetical protein
LSSFAQLITPRRLRAAKADVHLGGGDSPGALMPPGSAAAATLPQALSAVLAGLSLVAEAEAVTNTGEADTCQRDALQALCAVGVSGHAQALWDAGFFEAATAAMECRGANPDVGAAWLNALLQLAADADWCAALVAAGAGEAVQQAGAEAATAGVDGGSDEETVAAVAAATQALQLS